MRAPTDKIISAVRIEGIILDDQGDLIDGAAQKIKALQEDGRYIILVSPRTSTLVGLQSLQRDLMFSDIAYDDLWCGSGIPETDEWYDANAMGL